MGDLQTGIKQPLFLVIYNLGFLWKWQGYDFFSCNGKRTKRTCFKSGFCFTSLGGGWFSECRKCEMTVWELSLPFKKNDQFIMKFLKLYDFSNQLKCFQIKSTRKIQRPKLDWKHIYIEVHTWSFESSKLVMILVLCI